MGKTVNTPEEYDEALAKIRELEATIIESKKDSWFAREITGEKAKRATVEAELDALKTKVLKEARERMANAADAEREEKERIAAIRKTVRLQQTQHTRFRVMERSPAGQRDITGDPTTPVVDMRITLNRYSGGLYIPVTFLVEIAQSLGMLTASQSTELLQNVEDSNARANVSTTLAKELKDGIDNLISEFNSKLATVVSDVPDDGEGSGETESKSNVTLGKADDS